MNNILVTVLNPEQGIYREWRGCRYPVRAVQNRFPPIPEHEGDDDDRVMRTVETWACNEQDVDAVVEEVSKAWVGFEIKIFKLTGEAARVPGELRKKELTKDGILPI